MSQANNFYPIVNVFKAMSVFAELKDLGAEITGEALPNISLRVRKNDGDYVLVAGTEGGKSGYRISVDGRPLLQGGGEAIPAESVMSLMVNSYEETHKGKLPFVLLVRDGEDTIKLLMDGTMVIHNQERGPFLVELVESNSDKASLILQNILDSTF
jgi:hypothetical protein